MSNTEEIPPERVSIKSEATPTHWTKEQIVNEIIEIATRGESLNYEYMRKNYLRLHRAAQRHFGSWRNAIEASGFSYEDILASKWSKDTVTKKVLELQSSGTDLSSSKVQEHNARLFQAGCRLFGSWKETIENAGIPYEQIRKQRSWTKESVIRGIQQFNKEHEGRMSAGYVIKQSSALYLAARRLYPEVKWPELVALALYDEKVE